MACVDDDAPPPMFLSLAWQCERWRTLPEPGALYNQDYETMQKMTACANIYAALTHLRNAHGAQIHSLSSSERAILGELVEMGLLFNG